MPIVFARYVINISGNLILAIPEHVLRSGKAKEMASGTVLEKMKLFVLAA
jgi:hypothetical protein